MPPSTAMADVIVDIMTEVLLLLGIATKEIKQCRSSELIGTDKLLSTYFLQKNL